MLRFQSQLDCYFFYIHVYGIPFHCYRVYHHGPQQSSKMVIVTECLQSIQKNKAFPAHIWTATILMRSLKFGEKQENYCQD